MPIVLRPFPDRASLPTRLADLGRSRKAARVLTGAFISLAAVLAVVTLCCALDAVFGLSALARAAFLLVALAAGGALLVRGVWRPMRETVRPQAVAHMLEERYPKLNDSLASAVDFLSAGDMPATSARFRRIAVVRAQRALEKCDVADLVPRKRAWQAFGLAALAMVAAGGLGGWKPLHAGTAVVRLADPFGEHDWPTKTQIEVVNPKAESVRAALGDPFELSFLLRGVIPEHATVAVELENGAKYEEVVQVVQEEGKTKAHVDVTLDAHRVPASFRFQVRANDAVTKWKTVTLAPPPKLVPLDGRPSPQMSVTYPAYTDLPAEIKPDGAGVVEGPHGTRVRLTAATDRPVVSAVLVPQADRTLLKTAASVAPLAAANPFAAAAAQPLADETFEDIPVTVTAGTRLSADFIPKVGGSYLLKFTDDTGLSGTRLLEFRITPDPAPLVTLHRPAAGKDPLILLPTATTTVRLSATDRYYALRSMFVEYRVGGPDATVRRIPLADLSGLGGPLTGVTGGAAAFTHAKQFTAEATVTLPISLFIKPNGLPPADGDRILLWGAATDYDDVSVLKDPGRSPEEVMIVVVSRAALDTTLQQELAKLRPKLLQLREQQRETRAKTEEVQKAAAEGKLVPDDGTKLGQAERDQRGVRTTVTDPADGLQQAVKLLEDTIKANAVPRSTVTERVETLAADLERLSTQNLDPVEPLIATAKQQAEAVKPDNKRAADDLRKAVQRQKAAEANLDGMLKLLEQWGGAGEVKAEARALKELLDKAGEKGRQAAEKVEQGKPAAELTKPEQADLGKAAEQFDQLADRAAATIAKAEGVAAKKEEQAAELRRQADAKAAEAEGAKGDAAKQPPGSAAQKDAAAKAEKLAGEAAELKADADKAQAEADALRDAVKNAGNQGLKDDLQTAADKLRQNNPEASNRAQQSAAGRLDAIAEALGEKPPPAEEELQKKGKTADDAFALEQQQDELRKKVKEAEKIADPAKREEELKKLAREQEQLQKKAEDLLEKLTRDRQDAAADKLRESIEQMEAAKQELEQGKAPNEQEQQALDRLQETVDKLDKEKEKEEQKLSAEKRGELAEQLKGIRDRLRATDDEAARIQAEVLKKKAWDRAKVVSLGDLEDRAKAVAEELRQFTAKELEQLPVYKQLAEQAATQTDAAAKRFGERKNDTLDALGEAFDPVGEAVADDRTRRPLKTAIRRLNHILDSLAEDKKPPADGQTPMDPMGGQGGGGGNMGMGGGEQPGGVPPLAQLKALRSIQAELNDRTREFDTAHPDKTKLTQADREELEELERSQREVAELFDKVKGEFEKLKSQQEPKLP